MTRHSQGMWCLCSPQYGPHTWNKTHGMHLQTTPCYSYLPLLPPRGYYWDIQNYLVVTQGMSCLFRQCEVYVVLWWYTIPGIDSGPLLCIGHRHCYACGLPLLAPWGAHDAAMRTNHSHHYLPNNPIAVVIIIFLIILVTITPVNWIISLQYCPTHQNEEYPRYGHTHKYLTATYLSFWKLMCSGTQW